VPRPKSGWAQWRQAGNDRYAVEREGNTAFGFDGLSNRVLVPDAPAFHFGSNQDLSVEAWIKAYPPVSKWALRMASWSTAHPVTVPWMQRLERALMIFPRPNDFGVMPIVDKHHTSNIVSAVGFLFYLDSGRLGCMISDSLTPDHRAVFVAPGPNLQDGHWHYVVLSLERPSHTGGNLYVDGKLVLTFDPTRQAGDLSNTEPLRIGNHANPALRCFLYGVIDHVALYRHALQAKEIDAAFREGRR
jgi:hypothetical protein